jgi:uncharacterized repeat protein (TIGR03803 family)
LLQIVFCIALSALTISCPLEAQTEKTLWSFSFADGTNPTAALVFDSAGNLYGTTSLGGSTEICPLGCGVAFELTPDTDGTWAESVLHVFGPNDDGINPNSSLVFDRLGRLLGTTTWGGGYGYGTVFQLAKSGNAWSESLLYSFDGQENGTNPTNGVTLQHSGHLYGAAATTMPPYAGMVFDLGSITTQHWYGLNPYLFSGNLDGYAPNGPLIADSEGNLYGTTRYGGAYNFGAVFKLTPNGQGWTGSTLYSFQGPPNDGGSSVAGLAFDSAGNLYGTTMQSAGFCTFGWCGIVFKLSPNADGTWSESVLHVFQGHFVDGEQPEAGVIVDQSGNIYGTTYGGGTHGYGTVYKLSPSPTGQYSETILWSFQSFQDGANPVSALIMDSAGNLYGTTGGYSNYYGTVFEIIP